MRIDIRLLGVVITTMVIASAAGACSGEPRSDSPTTPSPSAPVPTISGVSISGEAPAAGATSQFNATVTLSDGTSESVTQRATWESSDSSVATVNSSGQVTGLTSGEVEIRAKYQAVTGALRFTVRSARPTFVISGLVHEPSPNLNTAVRDVRIEVVGGSLANQVFSSDERGRFSLPPVQGGDFFIYFKKPGYDDARFWVRELPRDGSPDVALVPLRTIVERWSGTLERRDIGNTIINELVGWPGDVVFETRRTSEATLTLVVGCVAFGTYTDFGAGIDRPTNFQDEFTVISSGKGDPPPIVDSRTKVLPAGTHVLWMGAGGYLGPPCPWSLTLSRPY